MLVDGIEFKGRAFIASTVKETWAFSEMPVKEGEGYMISEEFRNREAFSKVGRLTGDVLPILLGEPENFNKFMEAETDGIYRVTIDKIDNQPEQVISALDLIKQPLVMFNKLNLDLCIITKYDNQYGAGQSLMERNFGESSEYFLDEYVLYNGKLNEKQTKFVFDILNK